MTGSGNNLRATTDMFVCDVTVGLRGTLSLFYLYAGDR